MGSRPRLDERLDELRRRLAEAGAPAAYVERLVGELEDHAEDLLRAEGEVNDVEERLGPVDDLVEAAVRHVKRESWWGRMPVMVLLLAPLLAVPICWAVFLLASLYGGELLRQWLEIDVRGGLALSYLRVICWVGRFGVATVVAVIIYRRMRENWYGARLAWAAACVAGLAGSMTGISLRAPGPGTEPGTIIAALAATPNWAQLGVTLGVVGVYAAVRGKIQTWEVCPECRLS